MSAPDVGDFLCYNEIVPRSAGAISGQPYFKGSLYLVSLWINDAATHLAFSRNNRSALGLFLFKKIDPAVELALGGVVDQAAREVIACRRWES